MKLKMSEDGNAVLQDGKPVYVHEDGKEIAFDAPATVQSLTRTLEESKKYKQRAQTAEDRLVAFEGIEDPAKAKDALRTVANLKDKQLVEAGDVERVKSEVAKVYEEKLTAAEKRASDLQQTLNDETIGGAFARSKFIADRVAIPSDFLQARFKDNVVRQDGKIVVKDFNGNVLYSRASPGDPAPFDEGMEMLIGMSPQKDHILKGTGHKGDGASGSNGGGANAGGKVMPRSIFDALSATDRASKMKDGYTLAEG
jgi:hypothetical protein